MVGLYPQDSDIPQVILSDAASRSGWFLADELDLVGATMRHIFGPAGIPESYLVVDLETTGFKKDYDVVTQVGWAVVVNRQIVNCEALYLNWEGTEFVEHGWMRHRLRQQADNMAQRGIQQKITADMLERLGIEPLSVLNVLFDLMLGYVSRNQLIVGHNFWKFDSAFLDYAFDRFMRKEFPWTHSSIMDTGIVEKASQLNLPRYESETLDDWFDRVERKRAHSKWGLDSCVQKYNITQRFGLGLDQHHDAGHDCRLTWAVFETFRELAFSTATPEWQQQRLQGS